MTDSHTLHFMGDPAIAETFRGRIYGAAADPAETARIAFVQRLAGDGVLDCPAFDGWVAALQARGWLPAKPELEPHPNGIDRAGRWRLTPAGRAAWATLRPKNISDDA